MAYVRFRRGDGEPHLSRRQRGAPERRSVGTRQCTTFRCEKISWCIFITTDGMYQDNEAMMLVRDAVKDNGDLIWKRN